MKAAYIIDIPWLLHVAQWYFKGIISPKNLSFGLHQKLNLTGQLPTLMFGSGQVSLQPKQWSKETKKLRGAADSYSLLQEMFFILHVIWF